MVLSTSFRPRLPSRETEEAMYTHTENLQQHWVPGVEHEKRDRGASGRDGGRGLAAEVLVDSQGRLSLNGFTSDVPRTVSISHWFSQICCF